MFRQVELPTGVEGRLYLHSMPGRYEPVEHAISEVQRLGIARIVSLAPIKEIRVKSPTYATAIEAGSLPCAQVIVPIPDYGVPETRMNSWLPRQAWLPPSARARIPLCIAAPESGGRAPSGLLCSCAWGSISIKPWRAYVEPDQGRRPQRSAICSNTWPIALCEASSLARGHWTAWKANS